MFRGNSLFFLQAKAGFTNFRQVRSYNLSQWLYCLKITIPIACFCGICHYKYAEVNFGRDLCFGSSVLDKKISGMVGCNWI